MEEYVFELRLLNSQYYIDYPSNKYVDILSNQKRGYVIILFETKSGYLVGTPFRSKIRHNNCYHFKNSARSKRTKSGIDYSKSIILVDDKYVDKINYPRIDQDEYNELILKQVRIMAEISDYIDTYISHHKNTKVLDKEEYERRYKYTSLKYFHKELGIK